MLLLTLCETHALNRLSSFKNLRRKGGKFDHRPGRPKVLLRHCWRGHCTLASLCWVHIKQIFRAACLSLTTKLSNHETN